MPKEVRSTDTAISLEPREPTPDILRYTSSRILQILHLYRDKRPNKENLGVAFLVTEAKQANNEGTCLAAVVPSVIPLFSSHDAHPHLVYSLLATFRDALVAS